MRVIVVSKQEAGQRLDRYLAKYMSKAAKSFFYKMLRKKNITLNGKKQPEWKKYRKVMRSSFFCQMKQLINFAE